MLKLHSFHFLLGFIAIFQGTNFLAGSPLKVFSLFDPHQNKPSSGIARKKLISPINFNDKSTSFLKICSK
jgi:hypothetical protein